MSRVPSPTAYCDLLPWSLDLALLPFSAVALLLLHCCFALSPCRRSNPCYFDAIFDRMRKHGLPHLRADLPSELPNVGWNSDQDLTDMTNKEGHKC